MKHDVEVLIDGNSYSLSADKTALSRKTADEADTMVIDEGRYDVTPITDFSPENLAKEISLWDRTPTFMQGNGEVVLARHHLLYLRKVEEDMLRIRAFLRFKRDLSAWKRIELVNNVNEDDSLVGAYERDGIMVLQTCMPTWFGVRRAELRLVINKCEDWTAYVQEVLGDGVLGRTVYMPKEVAVWEAAEK